MREFVFGNLRVQLLSEDIIRLEYAKKGKFCDKNTLLIPDRGAFGSDVKYKSYGSYIIVNGYTIAVPDGARSLSGVKILHDGVAVYSYKKLVSSRAFPPLTKVPEVFAISDNPRVTVPDGGYIYRGKIKNSGFKTEENVQDVYLLLCDKSVKKLSRLYSNLTGKTELPLISAFGNSYKEKDIALAKDRINDGADEIILDCDLKNCDDKAYLSELKTLTSLARSKGVRVSVKCAPEAQDGIFSPQTVKLLQTRIFALLRAGVSGFKVNSVNFKSDGLDFDLGAYAVSCIAKKYYCTKGENKRVNVYPADKVCFDIKYKNLLPVIYKSAYESYLCGEPVIKQPGWEYDKDKRALKVLNEYILGNNILAVNALENAYLPEGKWVHAYDGKVYSGGKILSKSFEIPPVFIRAGALVPLSDANCFENLIFDYYPCKEQSDESYLYEDDGETKAYTAGKCRKSAYKAHFDGLLNAYKIILQPAKGSFDGAKGERRILFKYHALAGEGQVKKITVNGADREYVKTPKNAEEKPFGLSCAAPDGATYSVEFVSDVKKFYEIAVYLL